MQRRSFLAKVVGVSAAPLFSQAAYAQAKQLQAQAKSADLKITAVELWEVKGDARKYDSYLEDEYPKGGMEGDPSVLTAFIRSLNRFVRRSGPLIQQGKLKESEICAPRKAIKHPV